MSPEAKESPPPTRSRISRPGRGTERYRPPSAQHTALQSLRLGRQHGAQGRRHDTDVGIRGGHLRHHGAEALGVERREVAVEAGDLEAQRRAEILFVAEHHVDERRDGPVDLAGALLAADRPPERGPVVQVVGDDGAVAPGRRHGLGRDIGGVLAERGEDAAAVEPARALGGEDRVPVDVARAQLRDGRVAAVGAADRAAHAEAALGEVEAVARGPADAVVGHPAQVALVDAAAQDELLDQAADRVVGERADQRRCAGRSSAAGRAPRCTRRRPPRRRTSAWWRCGPRRGRGAA